MCQAPFLGSPRAIARSVGGRRGIRKDERREDGIDERSESSPFRFPSLQRSGEQGNMRYKNKSTRMHALFLDRFKPELVALAEGEGFVRSPAKRGDGIASAVQYADCASVTISIPEFAAERRARQGAKQNRERHLCQAPFLRSPRAIARSAGGRRGIRKEPGEAWRRNRRTE